MIMFRSLISLFDLLACFGAVKPAKLASKGSVIVFLQCKLHLY